MIMNLQVVNHVFISLSSPEPVCMTKPARLTREGSNQNPFALQHNGRVSMIL